MYEKAPAVIKWIERMNNSEPYLQQGAWLEDDQIPETLLPILKRMVNEQIPVLLDTDKRLAQWRDENPDKEKVKRFIGKHTFTVEN